MARIILTLTLAGGCMWSQQLPTAPVEQPSTQPSQQPVLTLDVAPLAPPDLASPYAGPRDAARHRFQATLAQLQGSRNPRAAMQGFAEAFVLDRSYAPAVFNLGVIAAIAEKWEDALAAFEEASRLDPEGLGKQAAPSIERLRKLMALEATPEGKLRRRYDEALYPVLQNLSKRQPAEAMQALAEVGRIDPKRWEAPALLASLNGNGQGYDIAAKFLEIATSNAGNPEIKARLQKALDAAQRELRYDAARAAADGAADRAEFEKAGALYEDAWKIIPARCSNGLDAASAWLLHDDTARASTILLRLRDSGDPDISPLAAAMVKELERVEPAAQAHGSDAREFFRDAGSAEPAILSGMIPAVDTSNMELLARPLPRLVQDPEPVTLLAALSVTPADPAALQLPELPAPRIAGEHPWREAQQLLSARLPEAPAVAIERPVASAEIPGAGKVRRSLQVITQPAGARVFVGDSAEPACETPCTLHAAPAIYSLRLSLAGYRDEIREARVSASGGEVEVPLELIRGNIVVEAPGGAGLKVNGTAVPGQFPFELALAPGLYRIGVDFGQGVRERAVNVKPAARLRLEFRP